MGQAPCERVPTKPPNKGFDMDTVYFISMTLIAVGVILWAVQNERKPDRSDKSLFGMK
jgi:hypothetical protein